MKFLYLTLFLLGLSALSLLAGEMRIWTSASGKTIEASFVENRLGQVVLEKSDGEQIGIRLNQLSSADQIYVGSQGRRAPAGMTSATMAAPADKALPPALDDLFGDRLVNARFQRVSMAELAGKKIGIYFSASWCPPCRAFTPQLVEAYNQLQTGGKPFEVVLVGHDRTKGDMKAYMKDHEMPWLAVRFGDKHADALKKKFNVTGIPKLVVVDDTGKILSADARGQVTQSGAQAFDEW